MNAIPRACSAINAPATASKFDQGRKIVPTRKRDLRQGIEVFGRKNPATRNMKTFTNEAPEARGFAAKSPQITASSTKGCFERPKDRFVARSFCTNGRALIA